VGNKRQNSETSVRDLQSFKFERSTFCILNLAALSTLLLIHVFFANHFGLPTPTLVLILSAAFLLRVLELLWVQSRTSPLSHQRSRLLTWASILFNMALAFIAAVLTNRPDSQYFVLVAIPVIEAAFSFDLITTSLIILAAAGLNFVWIFDYGIHQREQIRPLEYFEAGTISLIYTAVGILVWMLVNDLRRNQRALAANLLELEQTRERLVTEEKLSAIGRLSSAIAHEIRNPVAMISSSLATAAQNRADDEQREAMYDIATKEALRLEELTNDFLAYARPRPPNRSVNDVSDLLLYVAGLSKAQAEAKGINIIVENTDPVLCECDPSGVQQILLNLVMNAIDACTPGGTLRLRTVAATDGHRVEVENQGESIPPHIAARIFEPFFTTKPRGTGLGLAIARNVARTQGGDVTLSVNGPDHVIFAITMPVVKPAAASAGRS
jgi:two-component system, NtrC family, sensor histidine kinase HydH